MKGFICKAAVVMLVIFAVAEGVLAQESVYDYVPTEENLKARKEFQDNKFGIFVHWGIYSMMGQGEWYMHNADVDWREYEKYASGFYPSRFNAAEWVSAFKAAGAKYICFTTRHHDGFSMFDTEWCDYDIVDATPFRRDVLKELAQECDRQGLKLHLYYSHIDWRRDDYPQGRTGHGTGRDAGNANWPRYYEFMNNQLKELLTNYGPIGAIWFDGVWDHDQDPIDWELPEQYRMIHELQPSCLIGNNHHVTPNPGEDIQIFERDQPGENLAGLSGQDISALPLETCQTMNRSWGYRVTDHNYKSTRELIHYLVETAGKNGNLLLNVGPQPNGEIPAMALERLKEMGEWLAEYGESIYGTRSGDIEPHSWGVTTRKGNKLYIHILDLKDNGLYLPLTSGKILNAVQFADKEPVRFKQDSEGVLLKFPKVPDEIDYVIEITLK